MKKYRIISTVLIVINLLMIAASATNIPDNLSDEEILALIRTGAGYYLGEGVPEDEFQTARWTSGTNATHQYITAYGFGILQNEKANVYNWYSSHGALTTVVEYSDWPDAHEIGLALRHHFYYVDTGENGNTTHASTMFVNHYNTAVQHYANGNTTEAFRFLGKALHYLEDASTPVHTSSTMYANVAHASYESVVNNNLSRFSADFTLLYTSYSQMSLSAIVPDVAAFAYSMLPETPFTDSSILSSADTAVPRAMKNVAAILNRFYLDVNA